MVTVSAMVKKDAFIYQTLARSRRLMSLMLTDMRNSGNDARFPLYDCILIAVPLVT